MLVKMVTEIRRDVEKEWREKLRKVELKLERVEIVGDVNYTHCGIEDCEHYYAWSQLESDNDFAYCEYCDREYCQDHQEYCKSCETLYCESCYHEKHLVFCDECEEFACPDIHKMKCDSCDTITEICKSDSPICMNCTNCGQK